VVRDHLDEKKRKASFLKKRSKKLFLNWGVLLSTAGAQRIQKFLRRFF